MPVQIYSTPAVTFIPRQQQTYDLICQAVQCTGSPPTRTEIAAEFGFSPPNAAEEYLRTLARKGMTELTSGASCGIQLRTASETAQHQFSLPSMGLMRLILPLVGRVAAGSPILAAEHTDRQYQVDPSLFSAQPDSLLKVRGMSMRDVGILDGDLLAVQRASEVTNGEIVVARLGDDIMVKRLQRKGRHVGLIAENPDFEPTHVDLDRDEFHLEGLAVGLIRPTAP